MPDTPLPPKHTPTLIDNDHFTYEGGMRQCISNFGRNSVEDICEAFELQDIEGQDAVGRDKAEYCIGELVRWCRNFNGETQRLDDAHAALLAENERLTLERDLYKQAFAHLKETLESQGAKLQLQYAGQGGRARVYLDGTLKGLELPILLLGDAIQHIQQIADTDFEQLKRALADIQAGRTQDLSELLAQYKTAVTEAQ
jgi:hypothetical protein